MSIVSIMVGYEAGISEMCLHPEVVLESMVNIGAQGTTIEYCDFRNELKGCLVAGVCEFYCQNRNREIFLHEKCPKQDKVRQMAGIPDNTQITESICKQLIEGTGCLLGNLGICPFYKKYSKK